MSSPSSSGGGGGRKRSAPQMDAPSGASEDPDSYGTFFQARRSAPRPPERYDTVITLPPRRRWVPGDHDEDEQTMPPPLPRFLIMPQDDDDDEPYDGGVDSVEHVPGYDESEEQRNVIYKRPRVPASSKAIQGLQEARAGDAGLPTDCAVCLQDFGADDKLRAMPCSHAFHQHCIFDWLRRNGVCPLCRQGGSSRTTRKSSRRACRCWTGGGLTLFHKNFIRRCILARVCFQQPD
ncbi:hypothetical protein EJB05_02240, partial [Eragrostis curvula]